MSSDAYIKLDNVSFYRGGRAIFNDVSLEIPKGKIVAVMGPSGTGKTTFLRLLGGQLQAQSGTVTVNGRNMAELSSKALYEARRDIGMLFQSGALFTNLNVFDNVAFPLRETTKLDESIIRDIVLMKLEAVGLRGAVKLMPSELSGGMSRRVALARAIVLDPQLIMYDEPFAGLDPIALGVIVRLIKELNQAIGMTSIIVSHDVKDTCSIADHVFILADGRIVGSGSPEELFSHDSPWVEQFMKGLPDGVIPYHFPAPPYEQDLGLGDA